MKRRVVVTGLGVVASNGIGKEVFWKANLDGKSGISPIDLFDTTQLRTKIAAQVKDFNPEKYMDGLLARKLDRFSQFAIAASKMAEKDSGIRLVDDDSYRIGVVLGSGLGGMFFYEKQILDMQQRQRVKTHPASIPRIMPNAPSAQVSIAMNLRGPNLTVSTACTSGNHAIGQAFEMIKQNKADVIFAGGTDAPLVLYNFAGFDALGVMSTSVCQPFDKNRDGFVMGEGAGVLVLEELKHAFHRGAPVYAEVVGYGLTSEAGHMIMPDVSGAAATQAMRLALKESLIETRDVDYVNAHGTATQANDKAETNAIKSLFKDQAYKILISSTKSMIGHTIGAAGAIEAIVCCLAIKDKKIPPTVNYENVDPECDLDYVPNKFKECDVKVALSNSFGFGGNNASLVFKEI